MTISYPTMQSETDALTTPEELIGKPEKDFERTLVSDKRLPNRGQDFENLYVRRMAGFSAERREVESLLNETILDEGVTKGFVTKTIVEKITAVGQQIRQTYQVTDKTGFCDWICEKRKNAQSNFVGFQEVIALIKSLG